MPTKRYRILLGDQIYAEDLPYRTAIDLAIDLVLKLLYDGKTVTIQPYWV